MRNRRTNIELFLDTLRDLSKESQEMVSNNSLRDALGWDEERYLYIRAKLRGQKKVTLGRGRGGTVGLTSVPRVKTSTKSGKNLRNRRTNAQLFLDKLAALSGDDQSLIPNKNLREALGWDEERYRRIHSELHDQRRIIVGTGYGGKVGLASAPGAKALTLFISYSHADEEIKSELVKHLEPLRRLRLIESWHDRKIVPGEEWNKTISSNLEKADIVLLLVSIDFINSPYCYDTELELAIERQAQKKTEVIPVILRSCMWQQTPFAKLQALPKDAKPVSLWGNRDDALANVADGIRQVGKASGCQIA